MRLTESSSSTRTENSNSAWGTAVWRTIAMPALPPSRRERASRAAAFASRVVAPAGQPALLAVANRFRG